MKTTAGKSVIKEKPGKLAQKTGKAVTPAKAPAVKGLRVRSDKRAEERAPLTAAASGQIMQLSGAKKTKENL
jgi:hypothetical protein